MKVGVNPIKFGPSANASMLRRQARSVEATRDYDTAWRVLTVMDLDRETLR